MGADLLSAFCRWPTDKKRKALPGSPALAEAILERFTAFIDTLDGPDDLGGILLDEDGWQAEAIKLVTDFIDEAFGGGTPLRDTDTFSPEDCPWEYLYTAGPSWGDVPTDSFDALGLIGGSGITEIPFDL